MAPAAILIAVGGLAAIAEEPLPVCVAGVRASMSSHSPAEVVLERFSACSLPERRLAYADFTLTERRALWRSHLTSFLVKEPRLTPTQQLTLRSIIRSLDSYIDTENRARAALERDGFSAARLRAEFGDSLGKALFATLGTDDRLLGHTVGETGVAKSPDGTLLVTTSHLTPTPAPKLPVYCSCSMSSDWCCQGTCGNEESDCVTQGGCGTFWLYTCNGLCELPTDK
ncbi:MAG: bacteriocin fulvocin C-related protein [bacterium]